MLIDIYEGEREREKERERERKREREEVLEVLRYSLSTFFLRMTSRTNLESEDFGGSV
jgi:hypothetical protein